jgi:O-antigen biosynthesis protein
VTDTGRHYDLAIDPDGETSHAKMLRGAGEDHDVLELGCASGSLTRLMAERGNRVVGVELDPQAAARAAGFCASVIVANLDDRSWSDGLATAGFDVVIAGDVIEHVGSAEDVLAALAPLLRPDGRLVASIPNVAHGSVRLALLQGDWTYAELGLLDRTHKRFFTRASIIELFETAGYTVDSVDPVIVAIDSPITGVAWDATRAPADLVASLADEEAAVTLQYVVTARPPRVVPPRDRAASPTSAVSDLQSTQARLLLDADEEIDRLRGELDAITGSRTWAARTLVVAQQHRLKAAVSQLRNKIRA